MSDKVNKYEYDDWLSCPECGDSSVYVEMVEGRKEIRPANVEQLQLWLRFHCRSCDYRSREFDSSEVMAR